MSDDRANSFLDGVANDLTHDDRRSFRHHYDDSSSHRRRRSRSRSPRHHSSSSSRRHHHHDEGVDDTETNGRHHQYNSSSSRSSRPREDRSDRYYVDDERSERTYEDYPSSRRRRDDGYDRYGGGGGGGYDRRGGYERGGDQYASGGGGRRDYGRPPPGGGRGGGRGRNAGGGRGAEVFEGFVNERDYGRGYGRERSVTPEDVIPISKRKRPTTGWDVKPPGFENYTAEQAKMTGMFNLPGQNRPTLPPGINMMPMASGPGNIPIPAPIGSFARQSRRLYIGNITPDATEEIIRHFFNSKLTEMGLLSDGTLGEDLQGLGLKGDEPVISVHLNYEKNYAFVEFRNSEEATNALAFDGIIFQNNSIKIRRPKDYVGPDNEQAPHVPGVISTNVPDTPNKIFIGGLPSYLTDDQVIELLKSFGELRAFNLVKEGGTGQSKGFAFCEYVDPAITEVACQGLNGMELGDRFLVVQRAAVGQRREQMGQGGPGGPPGMGGDFGGPGGPGTQANHTILQAAQDNQPTRVLQILNMVSPEELTNDQDYQEIVEDIKDECTKFGHVDEIKIPKPVVTDKGKVDVKASESVQHLGKVFVLFQQPEETTAALKAIAGRQFGGRVCICAYAPLEEFLELP
ncbi:hypothetical protein OIO90_002556 [Microbotryomycetes sp. JL221]|nr:hypothetical protein OIO90_002556 [Microbotryomycetes sp. JL221]